MQILGIGIDTVEIARVALAVRRKRFLDHAYTRAEQEYFAGRNWNQSVVAGNFAAKEAVLKALGIGLSGAGLSDIEVLRIQSGAPFVNLYARAMQRFELLGGKKVWVTISHDRWRAVAQAIVEGEAK